MIEPATLASDLVGQHTEGWGVGNLGKRPEKKSLRLPAHEGRASIMAKYMHDEVAYYYDSHPTAEALAEKLRSLGIDPDHI